MGQHIYKIVDKEFEGFVRGNPELLNKMPDDSILDLKGVDSSELCNIGLFKYPFYVSFIGKTGTGGDGPLYHFFNGDMDKIYTFYDVQ